MPAATTAGAQPPVGRRPAVEDRGRQAVGLVDRAAATLHVDVLHSEHAVVIGRLEGADIGDVHDERAAA